MPRNALPRILEICSRDHAYLCPRQVLGARLGLAGLQALGFDHPPEGKRILVIAETDGCFLDGLSAATGCTPGHRTLRIQDYGKTAAVFVDTEQGQAFRVAPLLDIRARAQAHRPQEPRRFQAQLEAYKVMPDQEMFSVTAVRLKTPYQSLVSRPKVRTDCACCGEEVINERTAVKDGAVICLSCAHGAFYSTAAAQVDHPAWKLSAPTPIRLRWRTSDHAR
jgi:formylmethanofuran dehydrogenase subunit E